jgi:hypothetical protein
MTSPTESALNNIRAEWVPSDRSSGTPRPPTDPSWNRFGDYIKAYPGWSGDAGTEGQSVAGSGDLEDHFRGSEEHDLTVSWWMQRHFVDSSGNANDPIGELITADYQSAWPTHEVVFRRSVADGGELGAGFREFVVASGAKPLVGTVPGDPSESEPIVLEAEYGCEKVTQLVIHQPADSVTPKIKSTSRADTSQTVTVESEDASTTDTFTLNGTTKVTGNSGSSFSDIDAIRVDGDHEGDIMLFDGSGTELLEDPITGSNTDGVEADRGVPLLGSGSHASAIGTDPENYLFLGTSTTYDGGALAESADADRLHALDLSIEVDEERNARQGTRRQAIDPGIRTISVEADVAGPHESANQNYQYYVGKEGDIVYTFPDGTVTVANAQPAETDDVEREGGDANAIYGVTFEGHGSTAITATKN